MPLHYSDPAQPGFSRKRLRLGWGYYDTHGQRITDRAEIDRLDAIGLPPAYTDAWFCADPNGHLQATGVDARGRTQYRYHPAFRAGREAAKFDRCAEFGRALPRLRARVEADLARRTLCRERAVAAVVRLLDLGSIRVGNEQYARANKSFGATTLRRRHARVTGQTLRLQFTAKSGKRCVLTITDRTLSRFVKRCQELPGQHLFRWVDADGATHPVTSGDVNAYLREAMGEDFTAKHFRTWGASAIAFAALAAAEAPLTLAALLEPVTQALGNTPAIARKSYVHPALIALARDRGVQALFRANLRLPRSTRYLSRTERGLIEFLEAAAAQPQARAA